MRHLRVFAFATREVGDLQLIREYLKTSFPRARVTLLLPAGFLPQFSPGPEVETLPYPEGGLKTWPGKLGILARGLRGSYHYCVFPWRFSWQLRLDALALLPLLAGARFLVILDPRTGPGGSTRAGFLGRYLKTYAAFHLERLQTALRRFYSNRVEMRVRAWLDPLLFLLLAVLARVHRLLLRAAARRPFPGARGRGASPGPPTVAFFISNLDLGGAQRQLQALLERSPGLFRPTALYVYVPHQSPFRERFEQAHAGLPIVTLSRREDLAGLSQGRRFLWNNLPVTMTVIRLARLLRSGPRPSVFHCWEFKANVLGAVAAGLAGTPVVLSSIRNLSYWKKAWDPTWWYRPADILTARLNDCLLANAEAVRQDYRRWARVRERRIHVLRNGLDPAAIPGKDGELQGKLKETLGWGPGNRVVGWVGRLTPQKDPAAFLDVARNLRQQADSLRFVVLGDGTLLEQTRGLCTRMGLDPCVRFLGARLDVYHWMQAMDILVMTSIIEGMPNVLIEALFMGIPCVTTDAGGAREVIADGQCGFVVPVGDVWALAGRTRELLRDPALQARFAEAGRRRAGRLFHADRMARETSQLYQRLLTGR